MIWGIGTGRCGTHSLAADLGGLHEPRPWIGAAAVEAYWGDATATAYCREVLLLRLAQDIPAVVDLHLSLLIPLICALDAQATFVWMWREPVGCVGSFLAQGAWTTPGKWPTLWRPRYGWPESFSRFDRALAYWVMVNEMIAEDLARYAPGRWQRREPTDLRHHHGRGPQKAAWPFTADETQRLVQAEAEFHQKWGGAR